MQKQNNTHFFIAVPIDEYNKEIINKWILINKENLPFKSWVHPEDYHITLAFLGHVEETEKLEKLKLILHETTSVYSPFQMHIKGIDTFGKKEHPRILWISLEESEALADLQQKVYNVCKDIGIHLDSKPFRPHITIARKWISEDNFIKPIDHEEHFKKDTNSLYVEQINLYQTHLNRAPKYEVKDNFPFLNKEKRE
ncbi:RNA 2',3'-cyclic phosphodiesterase [Metabacillus litoralis]|uniref:RNA 2',3'-cyclic phosphodiesterase n=1 Tax=Metabacillus litoralis TaxID=152268 RepID=A0A5C6W002_9BACI|nr:RNA 2',3'-cyclic phosphodiesterase [Metabacillus litoralis]TXC90266.1 RNA 2',3'-cyclic phosphodiesterase [Metabacillus litoralis]